MKMYHNPRCRKSREALQLLQERGIEPEIVEYMKQVPTADELRAVLKKLDMKAEELLRRNETVFREQYKGRDLTEEQWVEAMVAHPVLIERPIAVKGTRAIVGRPPEKVLELV